MADEKKNTGPEEPTVTEAPAPENPGGPSAPPAPEQEAEQGTIRGMEEKPAPSETVIDLAAARKAAKEKPAPEVSGPKKDGPPERDTRPEEEKAPWERPLTDLEAEKKPARRGRRPKAEHEAPNGGEPGAAGKAKPGRAAKKEKEPTEKAKAPKKEKAPRAPKDKGGGGGPVSGPAAGAPPAPEQPPEPRDASRGVEEKIVYLNLSDLHEFPDHPFKVRDDVEMQALVESVKDKGVHQPALVRPREGGGYEIIAGHRRQKASELAGFVNMPCIVREMTDDEAKLAMTDDNLRHREKLLPSEKAAALQQQFEAISHQGVAGEDKEGKLSMEIVGKRNGMSGKTVQRYRWLNDLVPELRELMDGGKLSFTPAVEISRIKLDNQKYIAVAIEGEQASPSVSQAQTLRKLDQAGELNHDKIDGILSQPKKEVEDKVIITTAELEKFFGKGTEAREMKDKILELLGDWKAKQPPELGKAEKKVEKEK